MGSSWLLVLWCLLTPAWTGKVIVPSGGRVEFLRERLYLWVMMPTSQATARMIPYFAQHYEELGVDTRRRVTVLLHRDPAVSDAVEAGVMRALREAFDVPSDDDDDEGPIARFAVVSEYSSDIKRRAVNAWLATLPADAFVVYADLDEFFEYPSDVESRIVVPRTATTTPRRGGNDRDDDVVEDTLVAFMMERVGANLTFPALRDIRDGVSIEDQFPLKCRTREKILDGNDRKHSLFAVVDRTTGERRQFNSSHRLQGEDHRLAKRRPGVYFAHYAYVGGPDGFMRTLQVKYDSKRNTSDHARLRGMDVYVRQRQFFQVANADLRDDSDDAAASSSAGRRHYEITLTGTGEALFRGVCRR